MNEFMNEQKDKLLINLVEPGRIGRCPFNSFFSFQLALPNGRADEKNRIDGPCGTKRMNERREKDLSFYLSGFTSRGGSQRQRNQHFIQSIKKNF